MNNKINYQSINVALRTPIVAVCMIIIFAISQSCHSSKHKGDKMVDIQLMVSLSKTVFMSGESMELALTVTNNGKEDVTLQTNPDWPFRYELRPTGKGTAKYHLSRMTLPWLNDPDAVEIEPEFEVVAPGIPKRYEEDPALYVSGGIAPGEYHLVAQCRLNKETIESEPIGIVIEPPQSKLLDMHYCTFSDSFVSVVDHRSMDEKTYIYQRETDSTLADYGMFYRYVDIDKLQDIGTAVYSFPRLKGRWIAFISDEKLGALLSDSGDKVGRPPDIAPDMSQPALVKPGFQMAPIGNERFGPSLFMVTGIHNGQACIQPFTVSTDEIKKGQTSVLGKNLPDRIMTGFSKARKGSEVAVAWAEKTEPGARIYSRTYTDQGVPVSPEPVMVFEKEFPLLAIDLAPISIDGEHWVHALFGPVRVEEVKENDQVKHIVYLSYYRIPLIDTSKKIEEYQIEAPQGSYETPVELWDISGYTTGSLKIIAKHKEDILHASAQNFAGWEVLFSGLKQTSCLHLAAAMSDYWCAIWIDPARGIMYGPMPNFDINKP